VGYIVVESTSGKGLETAIARKPHVEEEVFGRYVIVWGGE